MEGEVDRVVGDELLIFGDGCTGEVSLGRRRRRFRVFLGGSKLVYGGGVSMLPEKSRYDLPSPSASASFSTISSSLSISSSHLSSNSPISSSTAGFLAVSWPVAAALATGRPAASEVLFPIVRGVAVVVDGVWKYFD